MKTIQRYFGNMYRFSIIFLCACLTTGVSNVSAQQEIETGIKIFENRNYYGADKFFTDYLQKNPGNAKANYYLGRIALAGNKNEEATDYFEKATGLDPSNSLYYTWEGINYISILQQVDFIHQAIYAPKALSSLEKAVALDSMNALARSYLAGYYANAPSFAGGSEAKAIDQINTAVKIDSTNTGFLLQRGIMMSTFRNFEDAKKSFESAMTLNPEFYPSYFQMGRMCAEAGVYPEQGEICLIRFIQTAPKDFDQDRDDAWWLLGNIYLKKGDKAKAREAYEKAVSLNPDNDDFKKSLKNVM